MLGVHGLRRVVPTLISLFTWLLSLSSSVTAWATITQTTLTSGSNGADQTRYTTASVSPSANRLIIAFIQNSRGTSPASTPTLSGNGLTWVPINTATYRSEGGADRGRVTMFRAMGATPSAGPVTIDFGGVQQKGCTWAIVEFRDVDTSGTNGSGAVAQSARQSANDVTSLTITLAAFGSSSNGTAAMFAIKENTLDLVPETGWTQIAEVNYSSGSNEMMCQWRSDPDTTPSASWGLRTKGAGIAIEIKAAALADTTPPTGSILINTNASATNNPAVSLTLSATDDLGTVSQMRFSNDNVTYSAPEAYATTKAWTLASGDGTKTVYVKFSDVAGNWSSPASATIVLDTTPPSIRFLSPQDREVLTAPSP